MPPAPDSAKAEFHDTVGRLLFIEGITPVHHAQVVEQMRQRRRLEGQTGELNAIAIHVEDNGPVL